MFRSFRIRLIARSRWLRADEIALTLNPYFLNMAIVFDQVFFLKSK